jgi:hypothetical protein
MLACKFQSVVFDVSSELNFITCMNPVNTNLFGTLVNSHICSLCPNSELKEVERYAERKPEKRPPEAVKAMFDTACAQCEHYQDDKKCCYLMHNSKTVQEMLEDSIGHCPRRLW